MPGIFEFPDKRGSTALASVLFWKFLGKHCCSSSGALVCEDMYRRDVVAFQSHHGNKDVVELFPDGPDTCNPPRLPPLRKSRHPSSR